MSSDNRSVEHYFSSLPKSEEKFGLIQINIKGRNFKFLTASSVFSKRKVDSGTRLLIESMVLPKNGYVLDIGCGYGAVGIAAATFNPNLHVVMTDVNIRAVRLARKNVELNKITNAQVLYGFLYEPVEDQKFNCILSNPPVSAGMETVKAIIKQAPKVMSHKASLQMVIRSKIGGKTLPVVFSEAFGNCSILAIESGYRVLMSQKQDSGNC